MKPPGSKADLKIAAVAPMRPGASGPLAGLPRGALYLLAALASIAALYFGRAFLIPLLIGVLASLALRPVVEWLARIRVPRVIGAAVVVGLLTGGLGWGLASLSDNAQALIEKLPDAARKLRERVNTARADGPLGKVHQAAQELERAAAEAAGGRVAARPGPAAAASAGWVQQYLLTQSGLVLSVLTQAPLVLLLIYFLLASHGGHFRSKILRLVGPDLMRKETAFQILQDVDSQVQRFLLVTLAINILVGVGTWVAFALIGLEHPVMWGLAAGILHFIPYLGPMIIAVASGAAGFLQNGSLLEGLLAAGTSLVVATLMGLVLMTWLQSKLAHVNTTILFIGLLFFGWLWGAWGLLLGAPMLATAKVVCDHMERLRPIGELLGR